MPSTFFIPDSSTNDQDVYIVTRKGSASRQAHVLERKPGQVYVHYVNSDKRLDEWVPESSVRVADGQELEHEQDSSRKRRRISMEASSSRGASLDYEMSIMEGVGGTVITEEEYDIQHHKQITAKRNFDKVNFGRWQIKTWYFSPYPLLETELEEPVATPSASGSNAATPRIPGVARSSARSHGRTSDLLAGGLGRLHGEKSTLWVCDKCFKYMAEGVSWQVHTKKCTMNSPPGRKVYQRGAHIIWEVDGAKEKLYCQNLSLFGKLFIDIKTLFFDCDNFLFYILTDADSQRDHVLGFFSKEKVSFDDYNLACIVVLPPYQKKRYGMLMIEFSYELSRRAGKIGTPERPLSDLGLRSYLTYWISTIIRFLRRLLTVLPPNTPKLVINSGSAPDLAEALTPSSPSRDSTTPFPPTKRNRRGTKGWDGEIEQRELAMKMNQLSEETDALFASMRTLEVTANEDGSATSHVVVRCTLSDIAAATGLRIEDAAFAMHECGLLVRRQKENANGNSSAPTIEETIVIAREMVEVVARQREVKRMCMDLAHVLL